MQNINNNLGKGLSDVELQEFSDYLETIPDSLTLEAFDGFLTAIACSPDAVKPSTYFSYIWGDEHVFESDEELKRYTSYVFRHWNFIVDLITNNRPAKLIVEVVDGEICGNEWAVGFMLGATIGGEGWIDLIEDEDNKELLEPIVALASEEHPDQERCTGPFDREERSTIVHLIAYYVPKIYAYFKPYRKKNSTGKINVSTIKNLKAKVGSNEPCPCGSGLKFKKCCGKN